VKCFCEHGNEPPGFTKCWEILKELSDRRILKKHSSMKLVTEYLLWFRESPGHYLLVPQFRIAYHKSLRLEAQGT
jgi:hypothetical protein